MINSLELFEIDSGYTIQVFRFLQPARLTLKIAQPIMKIQRAIKFNADFIPLFRKINKIRNVLSIYGWPIFLG